MKSNIVVIDNQNNGHQTAINETWKVAAYEELSRKASLRLQLCAEEMLCMVRSITGEMQASFWIENEKRHFELHLSTKTVMDKEKRALLIAASTAKKNEAAATFLGKVREVFENAMLADVDHSSQIPDDALADLANHPIEVSEWDGYEVSVLSKVADQIKVGIRGGKWI